jgi:glycosyltransferase involved in cell wall biosynthesis
MNTVSSSPKPLRILLLLNLRWDPRLGAVRVYMDLADEWRAAGHIVERFSLSEAFPGAGDSAAGFALRQVWFAHKAKAFIKRNAARFDVIDSLIGSLPVSKQELGFDGLLVARSVGLYRLYERFEKKAQARWPRRSRGKFLGRVLYTFTKRWLVKASDLTIHYADLINVPNEDEADCLRRETATAHPIIVQPYGLTAGRRRALLNTAATPAARLARKKISFVGMWGARKGAHDWPGIIRRIRQDVPEARFCFLGTMVDASAILRDLGLESADGLEFISDYAPEDLPGLLADCTAEVFPSYVEGFGLAVLEQLAAGVPTVAYDVSGPRDILHNQLPELLVPAGDIEAVARAVCRILQLDLIAYEKLFERSAAAAAQFSWSKIAQETIDIYRERLRAIQAGPILFVQPFSLGSAGGGARILRVLLGNAPVDWHSVCSSPARPKSWTSETHLRSRPFWGKIETSRFAMLPQMTMSIFAPGFRRRLKAFCEKRKVRAIHTIPHAGIDFAHAQAVARELSLPLFISLHDDLAYTAAGSGIAPLARDRAMQDAWLNAAARFVISEPLGREYSRRYGARDFQIVTDGLSGIALHANKPIPDRLRIYFMGLFHMSYERNLRALLDGIAIVERQHPGVAVDLTCRCEYIRPHVLKGAVRVKVLPFASEAQIENDLEHADLLYMPIPFGQEHESFARYSVSTKMVTYVGSGVPILYHGPKTSAAFDLLDRHRAAIFLTTLDPSEIAVSLGQLTEAKRVEAATNALELARNEFMLADQTRRFWGTIARLTADA